MHEAPTINWNPVQAAWTNNTDAEAAIPWSSLAKFLPETKSGRQQGYLFTSNNYWINSSIRHSSPQKGRIQWFCCRRGAVGRAVVHVY